MRFLTKPNLPDGKVCLCAVAHGQDAIAAALRKRGIEIIEVPAHPNLLPPVAGHADMQLHDLGGGKAVIASGAPELKKQLLRYGFAVEEEPLLERYPGDIALNCFALNGYIFCNERHTSQTVLEHYRLKGARTVPVRQGYAKCSACIVDGNSIITADPSIGKAAEARGIRVLMISAEHILLPGYGTGFIGGCCGLLDRGLLAFSGKISAHPDYCKIRDFCEERGVTLLELTDSPLLDIGGILPLACD